MPASAGRRCRRAAAILWSQGRRTAAIAEWTQAMQVLTTQGSRVAPDVSALVAVLDSIGTRKLLPELREPADAMVRAYITRNGTFRAASLLRAAFRAAGDPTSGTDWLIDLGRAAPDQAGMLASIAGASWLPDAQRDRRY